MRWELVRALTDAPEWREMLPAQRRVFKRLAQKADDDGVVRMQMSTRKLAEYTDHSPETVRKMLRWLERDGKIRRAPGTGRTRSHYAIPPVWGMAILDPLAPALSAATTNPSSANAATATDSTSPNTAPVPSVAVNGSTSATTTIPPAGADSWCPAARERGYAHVGRRCCGQTARQVKAAEQRATRERVAEQERERLAAERRTPEVEQGRVPVIDRGVALARAELKNRRVSPVTMPGDDDG